MYSRSTEGDRHLCNTVLQFNLGFSIVLPFDLPPKLLFSFIHFKTVAFLAIHKWELNEFMVHIMF